MPKNKRIIGIPVEKDANNKASKYSGETADADEEEEYEVSYVASHSMNPSNRKPFFRVKYTGWYGVFEQPLSDLTTCPKLVERMEERNGLGMRKVLLLYNCVFNLFIISSFVIMQIFYR
jgi:hypothetical protein